MRGGEIVGRVTSAVRSPSLRQGRRPRLCACPDRPPGTSFDIKVDGRAACFEATVVPAIPSTIPTTSGRRCRRWPPCQSVPAGAAAPQLHLSRAPAVGCPVRGDQWRRRRRCAIGDTADRKWSRPENMGIADLSVLPRTGFKGSGTVEWLDGPGPRHRAGQQPRLSPGRRRTGGAAGADGDLPDRSACRHRALIDRLNAAWSWGGERPRKLIGYPMPRARTAMPGSW